VVQTRSLRPPLHRPHPQRTTAESGPEHPSASSNLANNKSAKEQNIEAITDRLGDTIHPPSPCFSA